MERGIICNFVSFEAAGVYNDGAAMRVYNGSFATVKMPQSKNGRIRFEKNNLQAENPGMRGCDVLAEIGRMWEKTDDKQRYIEMQASRISLSAYNSFIIKIFFAVLRSWKD